MPSRAARSGAGDELVSVRPVEKEAPGDALKACPATVALAPAEPLREVHQFVLEDPLQRVEAVSAREPAGRHIPVVLPESVEEDRRGNRDLESRCATSVFEARGLAPRARHPPGKSEGEGARPQDPAAETVQKASIVGGEQGREIVRADLREVRRTDLRRPAEEIACDLVRPRADRGLSRLPGAQELRESFGRHRGGGAPAAQRLPSSAATASVPRCFRNQVRMRSETSITNFGSRGPCGVRGYTTISVGTPRRSSAR